jgi:acyl carrier protein
VREVLLRNVVEKTGYPEDMLELDLDLEADLGIDTVKQVDIFARTREAFGVTRDPSRALRDFNTLRKVIEHVVERAQQQGAGNHAAPAPARAAAPVPAPEQPAKRSGGGGPNSVRDTLLAMDLRQAAGLKDAELRKLAEAMSSRLGAATPETESIRTLSELAQQIVKGR